jgi:hypothetical protein
MLLTKQPDGSLLIECRGDQFTQAWQVALQPEKVLMSDGRPAVRKETALGTTFTTIHRHAWDILKGLPRNRPMVSGKIRLCEWCGGEMKVSREYESCWCFVCPRCKSSEIHSKHLVGGTVGGGEKEKR